MARQSTRSDAGVPAGKISEKQLKRIWGDLAPQALAERLRHVQPQARWSASGHRISGCCPYHDDRTPSFHVYLDRGYAKCYGCGQFVWNPVALWAQVHNLSATEALLDLKQTFKLSFLTTAMATQFRAWERHQGMKNRLVSIAHETLLDVLNNPEKSSPVMTVSAQWLTQDRKIPLSAIPTFDMVGILPQMGVVLDKLDAEAAEENKNRAKAAEGSGGKPEPFVSYANEAKVYLAQANLWVGTVLFRYDIAPNSPGRLKLRRPNTHDFIYLDDPFIEELGFFGLGWNRHKHLFGAQVGSANGIHLVEGEFDALTLMGHQLDVCGAPQIVVVASGGRATANNIDTLYSAAGVEEIYLVGDAPTKNGDALIEAWLPHVQKLRARVFTGWADFPGAGDPDEAVLQYGIRPVLAKLVDVHGTENYAAPQEWVFDQMAPQVAELNTGDARRKVEIASGWGRLLKNPIECDAYVQACAKAFDMPAAGLKRQIVALEEDEPAFVLRLTDVLAKQFFVIGQEVGDGERTLMLWHRERKSVVRILIGDERSVERELAALFGPLYQFFSDHVGIPHFMQNSSASKDGRYLQRFDADCRSFAKLAVLMLAQQAVEMGNNRMAQGVHVVRGDEPEIYLVNGRSVYHGTFEGDKIKWAELEGPAHNGNIFDVGLKTPEQAWLKSVTSLADLGRAEGIDLRSVYDRLVTLLDLGWRFKHHQTAVKFMAAHLMAASVGAAFRRQPMVGVHAESQCGKSRLLMGLISGKSFPRLHVLSAAVGMDVYTAAGVRQYMANKARPLALDEFENEGANDKKTRVVKDVLEMFRNLTGEDNTVNYGSRSGEAVSQSMSMFVFVAAITKPEKVQDANRMIPIELVKGDVDDPVHTVANELGDDFVKTLRFDLDVALLPYVKRIQAEYGELANHYSKSDNRPPGVESRFMEGIQPALTILKIVGEDYRSFATEFCEARKFDIVRTVDQSEATQLVSWILESPQIAVRSEVTHELQKVHLLALLGNPAQRRTINSLSTGLFYDEAENLLVVNWTQAVQTVLRQHPRYSKEGNIYNIREIANRHETALKPLEIQQSGVVNRLRKFGLAAMSLNTISVFRLGKVLRSFEVEGVELSQTPTAVNDTPKETQDDNAPDYFGSGM